MAAAGTSESYIRVWSLDGSPLPSIAKSQPGDPPPNATSSRRLVGHSGPVYALSFSPSTMMEKGREPLYGAKTTPRLLLSCSGDGTIRLWSIDIWQCLLTYKGHLKPVWDVVWSPFGHYFLTASNDRTARLWSTNNIAALRIFAGHDNDVDHVTFHPNGAYIFTASCDKTVRMWDVYRGNAVRLFTGHTGNPTSIACAPNGKLLATADDAGAILLWDLVTGKRLKRMRGHGKGGIWSLAWSVESTVVVSGGADGTVRVWDVKHPSNESGAAASSGGTVPANTAAAQGRVIADGGAGIKIDGAGVSAPAGSSGTGNASASSAANTAAAAAAAATAAATGGAPGGGKKGKHKETVVTADQIAAFPTKKSPVYKVFFTGMNLVLAGGAYMP